MSTLVAQTISNGTVSTSSANVIQGSAKAWANWNGTNGTLNGSYNVSSVTRNGTGDYTVNFTNALANANYSALLTGGTATTDSALCMQTRSDLCTAASARVYMKGTNAGFFDIPLIYAGFFR